MQRQDGRRSPAPAGRRIRWRFAALPVLVALLALGIVATRGPAPVAALGTVRPEHTVHEFGMVRMQDGLLRASFPLAVEGAVDAVGLTTS